MILACIFNLCELFKKRKDILEELDNNGAFEIRSYAEGQDPRDTFYTGNAISSQMNKRASKSE